MSYSMSKRGATRSEVMEKVAAELDNVVAAQPIHAADRAQAQAAAESFLAIIPEPDETQEFCLSVSGSVGWKEGNVLSSAGVSVTAYLAKKEAS